VLFIYLLLFIYTNDIAYE